MSFLSRLNFSWKLGLMTGIALVGLVVFAFLAFLTLRAVRINSPMYQNIALGYQLAGDCYDPPASLVAALPAAIGAEDAATAAETQKYVDKLRQARSDFEKSHQHYQEALPGGEIRNLMRNESYPTGRQWFAIAEQEYIPALLAGDHEAARKIRTQKMDPLFVQHKAANDKLSDLTANWIPEQEKNAAHIIFVRGMELGLLFSVLALLLVLAGWLIARAIVIPVRRTIHVLAAVSEGDLSQALEVSSKDELGEVAVAVNRMIASFREVLIAISQAAERTTAATAELTSTAEDTSTRSHDHAKQTQQAAAAMVEMSAAITEVSNAAHSAAESGAATQSAAESGQQVMVETREVIRHAAEVTTEAAGQVEHLGRNSERIGKIVAVIEEIAGQTNLLALNAAIEAARAGQHGRGFAVVAEEVRRLAERTSGATHEIAAMIESIQQETSKAVGIMQTGRAKVESSLSKVEECGSALDQIVKLARESDHMVAQIASATEQQAMAVGQVTENMNSISRFTEHSSVAGEQIAFACGDLARMASELEQRVQAFRIAGANALQAA